MIRVVALVRVVRNVRMVSKIPGREHRGEFQLHSSHGWRVGDKFLPSWFPLIIGRVLYGAGEERHIKWGRNSIIL
ncbi:MAG: hypothetical protein WA323_21945 [Candidatus Nitrosopolaris sp.]